MLNCAAAALIEALIAFYSDVHNSLAHLPASSLNVNTQSSALADKSRKS